VYAAEPGSASENAVRLLASWAATQDLGTVRDEPAGSRPPGAGEAGQPLP